MSELDPPQAFIVRRRCPYKKKDQIVEGAHHTVLSKLPIGCMINWRRSTVVPRWYSQNCSILPTGLQCTHIDGWSIILLEEEMYVL